MNEKHTIYGYFSMIEDILDSACNDLPPELFQKLKEYVLDLINHFE